MPAPGPDPHAERRKKLADAAESLLEMSQLYTDAAERIAELEDQLRARKIETESAYQSDLRNRITALENILRSIRDNAGRMLEKD